MPSISGAHNGHSAAANVAIIDAARYSQHRQSEAAVLTGVVPFRALIDTGASRTMIGSRGVSRLGLQPVTMMQFISLGGSTWRPTYLFRFAFFPPKAAGASNIQVCHRVITGGELSEEISFDVLLGMDVITTGDLHIARNGTFSFSW